MKKFSIFIALASFFIASHALAAPSSVQEVFAGNPDPSATFSTGNFGSSVTSGNYILVVIRQGSSGIAVSSVTDTLGTSFTLATSSIAQDPSMYIYYGKLTSSGTDKVTVALGSAANFAWIYAVEVQGLAAASPLDVVSVGVGAGGVTDLISNAFSTNQANDYVVAGVSQGFATYTAGTNFTLLNGSIPHNPNDFGGVEEYIPGSTLSSYTAHITSSDSGHYTMAVAAFKAAAASVALLPSADVTIYDSAIIYDGVTIW